MPDGDYFAIISGGSDAKKAIGRPGRPDGGMKAFGGQLPKDGHLVDRRLASARQKAHEAARRPTSRARARDRRSD